MTPAAVAAHLGLAAVLAGVSALTVRVMIRVGTLDHPGARSSHTAPTPKGGGVGIVCAFLLGVALLYAGAVHARLPDRAFLGLIAAATAIAGVSYADDVLSWSFLPKLAAQAAAAIVVVLAGVRLDVLHLPTVTISLGLWGVPVTLAWLLFVTNAVNFIDGLNGLAAGSVGIAALFLAVAAARDGADFVYFASLLLAAGIAGFLPFNYPRARIFMGDVGSQFIGFVIAVLGVAATGGPRPASALLVPLLLAPILLDVAATLARRALAGERLTEAHRGHLYQVAFRAGLPAAAVSAVYWAMTAAGGAAALAFDAAHGTWKAAALATGPLPFAAWTLYVARRAARVGVGRW